MKNLLKLAAMLMCVVSMTAVASCSKDDDDDEIGINDFKGTQWKCTYNKGDANYGIAENAYVGTVWKFSDVHVPYTEDEFYLYKNGNKAASYSIDYYGKKDKQLYIFLTQCYGDLWEDNDAFLDGGAYDMKLNNGGKEMELSKKEITYEGSRVKVVYLRFKKM